jgi:D-alanyl-D-alanine carboxypeptidase/D-alanyl-D-alanine-endopeptidase (penicillin-binding protein 4)
MRFLAVSARLIRPLAFACLVLPMPSVYAATSSTLPDTVVKSLKTSKIAQQSLSVFTLPLNAPGQGTVFNADVSVNPASTMKLLTTFAALELLGPSYQWKTEFYSDGQLKDGVLTGNLYLKGGGDPKLNMEKLWLMLRDLRSNGVRQVTGDLVLDRSYFLQPDLPAFNDDGGDSNKPYLVSPDALLVNLKALRFIARAENGKVGVVAEPPLEGVILDNQIKPLKAAKCPAWPDVRYNPVKENDDTRVIVTGQLNDGCSAQTYLSLLDHPGYAAGAVRALFKELGGSIQGRNRQAEVPRDATLLSRALSPDLAEVIRDINKYSNNTMARQLFLSIGAKYRNKVDVDDAHAAQRVIRDWLARKGITAPHLVMENGSGLSRDERLSAREMGRILEAAWKSPYAAEFISSMPLVALDGTMRKRLRNTPLAGQAHIKTGTLNNVRAIAGFSRDNKGNSWVVVAILNNPKPWGASSILDQVLLDLYKQP